MSESADFTGLMREIEVLQHRIDTVFKRVNCAPLFHTVKQVEDAVSDNIRYYPADRKADLAEIFYAAIDLVYERVVQQDQEHAAFNPQIPADQANGPRLPQTEMLYRVMMPLGWALSAKWEFPELMNRYDEYLGSWTPEEASVILDCLKFFLENFPENKTVMSADVISYWTLLSGDREQMQAEDNEIKSRLLPILLAKRQKLDRKG